MVARSQLTRSALRAATFTLAALCSIGGAGRGAEAHPSGVVGTTFPADFPRIIDASLGVPVIGFGGSDGRVTHVPVIFLHGNNDTPFPTACNPFGRVQAFAQYIADRGYTTSELWALGYQGDQCDVAQKSQTFRSRIGHTVAANVPD